MPSPSDMLRQEIERQGVIPFDRFMQVALYHPEGGYYSSADCAMGRAGDFYTSVSVGGLFGELLAFQYAEWLETVPSHRLQLVEAGTHDGRLAADILGWLGRNRQALWDRLEYWIVEPSEAMRIVQRETLKKFASRVRWASTPARLPGSGLCGIMFSNELLDAMPVRRIGWEADGGRWIEWGVTWKGGEFIWAKMSKADARSLAEALQAAGLLLPKEVLAVLPDGFIVEISPAAAAWWKQAAQALRAGKLVTIDYGLAAEEWISPSRTAGTLRAYSGHAVRANVLTEPGRHDLTAHVNFTHLQRTGEREGLLTEGLFTQGEFLTCIAAKTWSSAALSEAWSAAQRRQFQTLVHPEHLGRAFRVLVQSRQGQD